MVTVTAKIALLFLFELFLASASASNSYPFLRQMTRQEHLTQACAHLGTARKSQINYKTDLHHILVDHRHKLLYCYVPKVACTNWKRVFMVLTGKSTAKNLLDIPGSIAHFDNSTLRLDQLSTNQIRHCLSNYTMFIMVRHPFERLLSAYRNKFEQTYSEYFKLRYGREIIKRYRDDATQHELDTGANVTFAEFVRFLFEEGSSSNEHWDSIYNLCRPCEFNYTLIGRYETLADDVRTLFDFIRAPQIDFPLTKSSNTSLRLRSYFQELSIVDMQRLYDIYRNDFKLFGYNLEELLGFDLA